MLASIEKALSGVDKTDIKSLVAFVEKLETIEHEDTQAPRILSGGSITEREVFEIFGFTNEFKEFEGSRSYDVPDIIAWPSDPIVSLQPEKTELLSNIAKIWPPCNESNVRFFVSILIHFAVAQINAEMDTSQGTSTGLQSLPSPVPNTQPIPEKGGQLPLAASYPVILKAHTDTEALISWETFDRLKRKLTVRGFTDYGVSYAQKTPFQEAFFTIKTTGLDEINENSRAQLLAYMGVIQKSQKAGGNANALVYGCITDGRYYQFTKVSNDSKVSRSKLFDLVKESDAIYQLLSQCLCALLQSSSTSSPSKPADAHDEVVRFEERVQALYDYEFEVETKTEDLIDLDD